MEFNRSALHTNLITEGDNNRMRLNFWINHGLFQVSWPACVAGAAYGWGWPGFLVVGALAFWQLHPINRHPLDWTMVGVCMALGLSLDTAWIQMGLIEYAMPWPVAGVAPAWIMLLWLALALAINHSLQFFKAKLWLAAVLGGLGSPMSYYAGSKLGAAEWVGPTWQVILATGLSWAIVLPALFWLGRSRHANEPPTLGLGKEEAL